MPANCQATTKKLPCSSFFSIGVIEEKRTSEDKEGKEEKSDTTSCWIVSRAGYLEFRLPIILK